MKCPVDNATLVMTERNGVEIDYCPTCRGVWLDRGELDKIIDRAQASAAPPVALPEPPRPGDAARAADPYRSPASDRREARRPRDDDDDDDDAYRRNGRRRRDSFLSDLFDF